MRTAKPAQRVTRAMADATGVAHALRTHQVDAIVGDRHVMVVRLKRAEVELVRSRETIQNLARQLLTQRETERAAIAREIHDELGQVLTTLQLGLAWIARTVPQAQRDTRAKVASLSELVTATMGSVRRIAMELRPGTLDELGVVKTLESEARRFEGHAGIPCRFETNLSRASFDPDAGIAIFRICQAALTNVVRHAQASHAVVTMMKEDTECVLTIADDGKGTTGRLVRRRDALGIVGMRERAAVFDGTVSIGRSKGGGTRLTVRLPLARVVAAKRLATSPRPK